MCMDPRVRLGLQAFDSSGYGHGNKNVDSGRLDTVVAVSLRMPFL